MSNEQLKRLYPIVCLVAVFMSFMFFYTIYQSEHESMMRLKTEYEKVLILYKTRLEDCRNE
jgi:hypothetical protein